MIDRTVTLDDLIKKLQLDKVYYETKDSEIAKFYAGRCVFLTGGTGFLGKILMEKLLRACPDISCIFILVRPKKGKDVHTRADEIFNEVIYEKLSKLQPKFRHKIVLVNGDVSLPYLGMTIEDRQLVTDKASIIIHSAATVKFNEKLNTAVDINVKGTKEIINLAKECKHLASFVHISTVFSHCYRNTIGEELYEVPYDPEKIIQITNVTPPTLLEKITPDLLGEWPNTYVFTKAIAEDCIRRNASQLPVCIVRPAIIIATYKEPIGSWIDNIYGPTGIVVGAGVGLIRVVPINKEVNAEHVPVDLVANSIIAASYKTATERTQEIPVYNYVSSPVNPLMYKEFAELNAGYGIKSPSRQSLWIYSLILLPNFYFYHFYKFFAHTIPGAFMDIGLILIGKKPQLLNAYKKIHNFGEILRYFGERNWSFKNDNVLKLYNELSEADKKLFDFDMSKVNWNEYYKTHCLGLRTYLLKEDLKSIPVAIKRDFMFRIAHYVLRFVIIGLSLRLLYSLITFIFS